MINKEDIDQNAMQYYRMLKSAGFSAYFVGGSVRDLLLGKHPKDFDIATNATPHQIKRIIPHGRIIGRRFRHVMLERHGGRYEIVTFRGPILNTAEATQEQNLEETPQEESQPANESDENEPTQTKRHPDLNQFGNAEQDALRRDFTINALFYDPDSDELVDYVQGKLDIDRKLIRSIGDPQVRMEEDPIRILRAIRHKMKLDLEYEPSLEAAMRDKAALLEATSKDRIREEFLKVCNDQSLGNFLQECHRVGLGPHIMPWYANLSDQAWDEAIKLWDEYAKAELSSNYLPDAGLALIMSPVIQELVLDPFKATVKEGDKNYLPDMKYFLSCEELRNYYLRNLRISRAQTDHIVRALFYFSRMTGLWLEQGPPRRIIGKLFHHPPALLAANLAKMFLKLSDKECPEWIIELSQYDPRKKKERTNNQPREHQTFTKKESNEPENNTSNEAREEDDDEEFTEVVKLSPPDRPMVWNGPLHAPAIRPIFAEEPSNKWARKDQTARAFRPSGIPNQPRDLTKQKMELLNNYKPELDAPENKSSDGKNRDSNNRPNNRNKNPRRDKNRQQNQRKSQQQEQVQSEEYVEQQELDEDSIGNQRGPGEAPAALSGSSDSRMQNIYPDEEIDDDIGNRIDLPPTSGHNPEAQGNVLTHHERRTNQNHKKNGGSFQKRGHRNNKKNFKRRPQNSHSHGNRD
ncbi:MAG: CCA tRNA nucleotidyltransferase [Oligoflexia bacterium]|nr:CCA tRNA nucleotidyltransferase [Oligoflexia bacterium]